MLENFTKIIARLFGIIAGSLSGIGGILMATGYLAERSHLKMLGFTNIPVDLNQYLYTGANLVGFLPGIIILQSVSWLFEPLTLAVLAAVLLLRFSLRIHSVKMFWNNVSHHSELFIISYRNLLLIFFVLFQMLSLNVMVKAVLIDNLLFMETTLPSSESFTIFSVSTDELKQHILTRSDRLPRYFTQLFLLTLFLGLALQYTASVKKVKSNSYTFQTKFWIAINFVLFTTHVILLPCNYGILLLNNTYQEVKVQFNQSEQQEALQEEINGSVPDNRPLQIKNKIRAQRLETYGTPFQYDLEAAPRVFTASSGDKLIYSASSGNPDVAVAETDKNILTVRPYETGEARVTVKAENIRGESDSVSFSIIVVEKIDKWGAEIADSLPPATLVVGGESFIRDLTAEPVIFHLLDKEPVHLTFRASSGSTEVATVNIEGDMLEVQPVSKGKTSISVFALDGYGRRIGCKFDLFVLDNKLSWPVDNRLLLIYQSNDVFYLYSKMEKRIWYVRSENIESMVYYGLTTAI